MSCFPQIRTEDEYDARLDQLDALVSCIMEYERRVHPIGEPTRWGRFCFAWQQRWRWLIAPMLIGLALSVPVMLILGYLAMR